MPVNHAKEYLIFVHTGVVFLQLLARASNGSHYSNFENWCLKMKSWGLYHAYILWQSGLILDFQEPNLYYYSSTQHIDSFYFLPMKWCKSRKHMEDQGIGGSKINRPKSQHDHPLPKTNTPYIIGKNIINVSDDFHFWK